MYKLVTDQSKNLVPIILRIVDNAYIPMSEANTDYQAYLAWVAEGNEPLLADEGTV